MELPEEVGIMVLPDLVFFPHNLAPLHIFEPRYREMLANALATNRMFALSQARTDSNKPEPMEIGGVGLIRACVQNDDGTANLILQGIARVRFVNFTQTDPYFIGIPVPLESPCSAPTVEEETLAAKIVEIACLLPCSGGQTRQDVAKFLNELHDYNMLVDIVAGNFLRCPERKQRILETEERRQRLQLLALCLHEQVCQD
ncbi:MAG: LON peptidase substrate-binding domain-containing protein [Candidatus Methylacidiphilales bacterium]|nr:LON peptidase substrate-binding domain-containing protein [Candidatus Methylacidiphilales bacterium]